MIKLVANGKTVQLPIQRGNHQDNVRLNLKTKRTYDNTMVIVKKDVARNNITLNLDSVSYCIIDGTKECNLNSLADIFISWIGIDIVYTDIHNVNYTVRITNDIIALTEESPSYDGLVLELEVVA